MLTKGDIADIISERLERGSAARPPGARQGTADAARASRPLPKRVFISDREMRRMFKEGQKSVRVPANAIISPLSADWLDYDGIEVIRG